MNNAMSYLSLHCTDALPDVKQLNGVELELTITKTMLEKIEQDLEEYEQISILFLICAEISAAYEQILQLYSNRQEKPNMLTEFIKVDTESWSDKLLEAFCIINNKEVIRNLGLPADDFVKKYHPNISRYTAYVHPVAKVLYNLFESMPSEKAKKFLKSIYKEEHITSHLQFEDHLELHIIYLLQIKFINISSDKTGDLSKLLKHMKRLEYGGELIYQDVEFYSTKMYGNSSRTDAPSQVLKMPKKEDRVSKYLIRKGQFVLINEEHFTKTYEDRDGTKRDGENLKRTFAGLGFDIEEFHDLTKDEILKELKRISTNFDKSRNCLVVAILSHGYEGGIISSDDEEISTDAIEKAICTEHLYDIAKILIIQACQGSITGGVPRNGNLAMDGPASTIKYKKIVHLRNFARFMSTMRGFNSIRHKEEGSWFIQAICEVLSNSKGNQEDCGISVEQWHTSVTRKVSNQVGYVNNCAASQIPEFTTRLEVDVYFPPYSEEMASKYTEV